jgi:hypothetical protein
MASFEVTTEGDEHDPQRADPLAGKKATRWGSFGSSSGFSGSPRNSCHMSRRYSCRSTAICDRSVGCCLTVEGRAQGEQSLSQRAVLRLCRIRWPAGSVVFVGIQGLTSDLELLDSFSCLAAPQT